MLIVRDCVRVCVFLCIATSIFAGNSCRFQITHKNNPVNITKFSVHSGSKVTIDPCFDSGLGICNKLGEPAVLESDKKVTVNAFPVGGIFSGVLEEELGICPYFYFSYEYVDKARKETCTVKYNNPFPSESIYSYDIGQSGIAGRTVSCQKN